MLDDQRKIGYVRLTSLGKESPKEMAAALNDLESRGVKALIVDLRNNPGGSLSEAVAVADLFVESGRIVTVKGRTGEQAYDAHADGMVRDLPMALLVNRQTASAAEIIAACLQDHHRAVLIGERTFGQALVKSLFPLKGGSALKLPVAAYYRPNGKSVHRFPHLTEADDWGVKPDEGYEVAMTDDELKQYEKYRRERDALNAPATVEFHDRQLQAALGYITTQLRDH
jgi:carboxyl-terminal processing protease